MSVHDVMMPNLSFWNCCFNFFYVNKSNTNVKTVIHIVLNPQRIILNSAALWRFLVSFMSLFWFYDIFTASFGLSTLINLIYSSSWQLFLPNKLINCCTLPAEHETADGQSWNTQIRAKRRVNSCRMLMLLCFLSQLVIGFIILSYYTVRELNRLGFFLAQNCTGQSANRGKAEHDEVEFKQL